MIELIRIAIIEHQGILREGLRAIVATEPDLEVVGVGTDSRDAIRLVGEAHPDIVLMSISLPDMIGIDCAAEIIGRFPKTRIIFLTVQKDLEVLSAALEVGASGYVTKDATAQELVSAIREVLQGKTYLSPEIREIFVNEYVRQGTIAGRGSIWQSLTRRERQVLKLVAGAHTNKEIADHLGISVKTVEKHRASLMSKVGSRNVAELTSFALSQGVIEPNLKFGRGDIGSRQSTG